MRYAKSSALFHVIALGEKRSSKLLLCNFSSKEAELNNIPPAHSETYSNALTVFITRSLL